MSDAWPEERLAPGTRVEVRQRLDHGWAHGFEVAETQGDQYQLRRVSDRAILPVSFPRAEVRSERSQEPE